MLGGAMRQAGILAAAGIYALDNNAERLSMDHEYAARLAHGLRELRLPVESHTNMVFVQVMPAQVEPLFQHLKRHAVCVLPARRMRLVTHLDVDAAGIERALSAFRTFFA